MTNGSPRRHSKNGTAGKQRAGRRRAVLLVEDDGARSKRRPIAGQKKSSAVVRVHSILNGEWKSVLAEARTSKPAKRAAASQRRCDAALKLLRNVGPRSQSSIIVAGASYGSSALFVKALVEEGRDFAVEIRPSETVECIGGAKQKGVRKRASELLSAARWRDAEVMPPGGSSPLRYSLADLAKVQLPGGKRGRLFAAQTGGIEGLHPGTIIGITSMHDASLEDIVQCVGWARWIRPLVRRQERSTQKPPTVVDGNGAVKHSQSVSIRYRSNITLARLQDESCELSSVECFGDGPRGVQFGGDRVVNVVELFAGAGGMGLGFLMAEHRKRRFRLVFSGELHPIYVQTLKSNHDRLASGRRGERRDVVPDSVQAVNLNEEKTFELIASKVRDSGGADVLIGGPPCQGFSSANRNSWYSSNPQNRLVNVFLRYVEKLKPRVFLMENVQGIVWTAKHGRTDAQPSVADHIVKRMKSAGYMVFPKLLDAVWYGVPQFRTRFFVLGIHQDAGYRVDEFGEWGPFPAPTHGPAAGQPFITVHDAIGDLPAIGNGHTDNEMDYGEPAAAEGNGFLNLIRRGAPKKMILDHVSSRHADYVIERYRCIPAGGNWQDIAEMMSNYAEVQRTHSNIYRRLKWGEPSITIGHYRKSMLVHPEQHRGLSLREACRLQSFPDWFRFSGTEDGGPGGLMHKQQQLANAVCPLLSKAIAEFILEL